MNSIILLLVFVVVVVVVLALLKAKAQGAGDDVWPFYAKKPLSQPEQILYFRLVQALPDHIILAQVQLSCLLGIKKGNQNRQGWLNRINRMSADFVVCNKDSSIVAVIELDDATHEREDRQAADAKKDKALGSAGVQIVRWQAKAIPDLATIQRAFMPKANA